MTKKNREPQADSAVTPHLTPEVQAGLTLSKLNRRLDGRYGDASVGAIVEELRFQTGLVERGELARTWRILVAQAHTLDALFNKLVSSSNQSETRLRLALDAQSQCRATLETLCAIRMQA